MLRISLCIPRSREWLCSKCTHSCADVTSLQIHTSRHNDFLFRSTFLIKNCWNALTAVNWPEIISLHVLDKLINFILPGLTQQLDWVSAKQIPLYICKLLHEIRDNFSRVIGDLNLLIWYHLNRTKNRLCDEKPGSFCQIINHLLPKGDSHWCTRPQSITSCVVDAGCGEASE